MTRSPTPPVCSQRAGSARARHRTRIKRLGKPTTDTRDAGYAQRLAALQGARWKRWLDVQAPYRRHLRALETGFILDVGCGIGRTLAHCGGNGVGIDHNPTSLEIARAQGFEVHSVEEFWRSSHAEGQPFDSLLFSHVLEHLELDDAAALVAEYVPLLRTNGRVICLCPQKAGFRSDPSHVTFCDFDALHGIAEKAGLVVERSYSFPLPLAFGRWFRHNEFVVISRKPE